MSAFRVTRPLVSDLLSRRDRGLVGLMLSIAVAVPALAAEPLVVNGRTIPAERIDSFVQAMVAQGRKDDDTLRRAVREELIARELFVQEAEKRTLQERPDVATQLARARQDILIGALIRDELTGSPVTDEEVRTAYDRFVAGKEASKEYRARHILVDSEKEAREIIAKLEAGEEFAELAKRSQDPGSAENGGDLDWNTPDTFVAEFGLAMAGLEKGSFTREPVKTQFGFHVIRLDDIRDAQPPSIEAMRAQLTQQLERDRVITLQKSLRDQAQIN
ncbi:MAG: peptidylprolyl isomerase [Burkholderiaceae bacterium]